MDFNAESSSETTQQSLSLRDNVPVPEIAHDHQLITYSLQSGVIQKLFQDLEVEPEMVIQPITSS